MFDLSIFGLHRKARKIPYPRNKKNIVFHTNRKNNVSLRHRISWIHCIFIAKRNRKHNIKMYLTCILSDVLF